MFSRITKSSEYRYIFNNGTRFITKCFVLFCLLDHFNNHKKPNNRPTSKFANERTENQFNNAYEDLNAKKHFVSEMELQEKYSINFRAGIIASKKVGNAVKRNRCKRLLRELYRNCILTKESYELESLLKHTTDTERNLCIQGMHEDFSTKKEVISEVKRSVNIVLIARANLLHESFCNSLKTLNKCILKFINPIEKI